MRQTPAVNNFVFTGGFTASLLFEEIRYCFVYGQYLAVINLGMSFLEHSFASRFYMAGRNDLENAGLKRLQEEALGSKLLPLDVSKKIDAAREIRNRIAHFRAPLGDGTIENRMLMENERVEAILESHARNVVEITMQVIARGMNW